VGGLVGSQKGKHSIGFAESVVYEAREQVKQGWGVTAAHGACALRLPISKTAKASLREAAPTLTPSIPNLPKDWV
jgi:hypothetical protein